MPSSVIRAFDYEPDAERLAITFTTGKRYAYCDVPAEIVRRLRAATSKGRFFNSRIRDRYRCEKLA
ncbi:KTSC domain-containing protein [Sphingomonas vulcanisoli]|nr:KTSC domain-containing protein [Sphingomonas vulcanisoli]